MSLLMKDKEFLEKYNEIWEKFSNVIMRKLIEKLYIIKKI